MLSQIENYEYEIIFVDDGSEDFTLEKLTQISQKNKNVKILSFSRNFGHQAAVTAGLQFVAGDAIVIIDSDLQDPPEAIPEMLKLWENGNDVIYGKRRKRKGESTFKLLTAKLFYNTLNLLSETEIPKNTGDFRLIDRKVVDTINQLPEHNKFLRGLFSWVGYKQVPYEYVRNERVAGKTKYPFSKMVKLAGDGILSFSTKPLKLVGILGIISLIISFLVLIYSILSFVFKWNDLIPGWTSIMLTVTFFAGVQLLSIWIMSEYIARIYDESRHRPQYIIDKTYNIDMGKKEK